MRQSKGEKSKKEVLKGEEKGRKKGKEKKERRLVEEAPPTPSLSLWSCVIH